MKPQHSKIEMDLLLMLTEAGLNPVTDLEYCVQSTTPDFAFTDKNLAVYIDGYPHRKREEKDDLLRQQLSERHGLKVVSIPYDVNTAGMRDAILDVVRREVAESKM